MWNSRHGTSDDIGVRGNVTVLENHDIPMSELFTYLLICLEDRGPDDLMTGHCREFHRDY